jgi:predicted Zn finger-like uncharacterized protein
MEVAVCPHCRTRYHVPDNAAGKRTRCKKCGRAFRVPIAEPAVAAPDPQSAEAADPFSGLDLEVLARGAAVDVPRPVHSDSGGAIAGGRSGGVAVAERPASYASVEYGESRTSGVGAYAHYLADVGHGLIFFTKPRNIITFMILWFFVGARGVLTHSAPGLACFGAVGFWMGSLALTGLYMAFKLNLVVWAAAGEREFPAISVEDGWLDDVIMPFLRMLATYVFAMLPAGIYAVILLSRMGTAVAAAGGIGGAPVPSSSAIAVLAVLALLGIFFWPMMVLVVSCGNSVGALFRLDLITETIVRSFPAYLLTVVAVFVTFGVESVVSGLVWSHLGSGAQWRTDFGALVVLPVLLRGIGLYFDVVAMRAIGAYYCHFKHRFAWSWG